MFTQRAIDSAIYTDGHPLDAIPCHDSLSGSSYGFPSLAMDSMLAGDEIVAVFYAAEAQWEASGGDKKAMKAMKAKKMKEAMKVKAAAPAPAAMKAMKAKAAAPAPMKAAPAPAAMKAMKAKAAAPAHHEGHEAMKATKAMNPEARVLG